MRLLRGVHPDVSGGCIRNAAQGDPGEAAKLPGVYDLYSGVQVQGDCYYRNIEKEWSIGVMEYWSAE